MKYQIFPDGLSLSGQKFELDIALNYLKEHYGHMRLKDFILLYKKRTI